MLRRWRRSTQLCRADPASPRRYPRRRTCCRGFGDEIDLEDRDAMQHEGGGGSAKNPMPDVRTARDHVGVRQDRLRRRRKQFTERSFPRQPRPGHASYGRSLFPLLQIVSAIVVERHRSGSAVRYRDRSCTDKQKGDPLPVPGRAASSDSSSVNSSISTSVSSFIGSVIRLFPRAGQEYVRTDYARPRKSVNPGSGSV